MRFRATRLLLIAATLCFAAAATAQTPSRRAQSDQQILTTLERDWDAAFHRKDVKFIETVLAQEFLATYAEGQRADREKELQNARDFSQQIDSSVLDEFNIKIFGDTAVVLVT